LKGVRFVSRFIFLHVQLFQRHLSLLHGDAFTPLPRINWLYLWGCISGLSILFHWSVYLSICLFFHQYHTLLIVLQYVLKSRSGSLSVLAILIFCLSIQTLESGHWYPQNNFWDFDGECTESTHQFGKNWHLNDTEFCYP